MNNLPSVGGRHILKEDGTLEQVIPPTGDRPCKCQEEEHAGDEVASVETVVTTPALKTRVKANEPAVRQPWSDKGSTSTPQE